MVTMSLPIQRNLIVSPGPCQGPDMWKNSVELSKINSQQPSRWLRTHEQNHSRTVISQWPCRSEISKCCCWKPWIFCVCIAVDNYHNHLLFFFSLLSITNMLITALLISAGYLNLDFFLYFLPCLNSKSHMYFFFLNYC